MPHLGEIAALATAVCWSANSLLCNSASKRIGAFWMNHYRMLFGFIFLAGAHLYMHGNIFPSGLPFQSLFLLAVSGLAGYFLCDIFLFQSYLDLSPRVGILIFSFYPFVGALLAWTFLGEHLSSRAWLGMAVTLAGIVSVLMEGGGRLKLKKVHYKRGVACGVLAALLQGVSFTVVKPVMTGEGVDPLSATLVRAVFGGAAYWLVSLFAGNLPKVLSKSRDRHSMGAVFAGSFIGPFIGVWLSLVAIALAPVGIASTLMATMPIAILPMSAIFHKERIGWRAIIGAIIACLGVALLFNA